jgi:hypothetical protein
MPTIVAEEIVDLGSETDIAPTGVFSDSLLDGRNGKCVVSAWLTLGSKWPD